MSDTYSEIGVVPDDYLGDVGIDRMPELRGVNRYRVLSEMVTQDATIGSILFAIEMFIRSIAWHAEPADETPEAQREADFLKECFDDMPDSWPNIMADILTFIPFSYSIFETVYKDRNGFNEDRKFTSLYDDGRVGWRKWAFRPQITKDKWLMDGSDVVAWVQRDPRSYQAITIPIEKCIVFRSGSRGGRPEGPSILMRVYRAYRNKNEIEMDELIGMKRDLAGLAVFELPSDMLNATEGEKLAAKKAYQRLGRNVARGLIESLQIPSDREPDGAGGSYQSVNFKLMTTGGARQYDSNAIKEGYRTEIAMSMLADFILVGHQKTGARAVSESKVDTLTRALTGWADMMQEDVNEQAVARLMRMNAVPERLWPRWVHDDVKDTDLGVLGTYVAGLVEKGVLTPSGDLAAHMSKKAGLPEPVDQIAAMEDADPIEPTVPVVPSNEGE